MSNLETLLTAWLNGGEIPVDFKPTSNVEEYLVAILEGVDDDVDPKSRADVLLDAIATKYAGYADGIADLEDELGMSAVPPTPQQLATLQAQVNEWHLQSLADKGITPEEDNTFQILAAYEQNWPSGGAGLNIGYGNTAPEDTSKLWVKTAQPQNVTVDYDLDNGVESVQALTAVLPTATAAAGGAAVGTKIYLFGGFNGSSNINAIRVFDTETNALTTLQATLPTGIGGIRCAAVGTKIYLFGGDRNNIKKSTIYIFDTETNALTTATATLPTAATYVACCAVGTKCYTFGGYITGGVLNTICVYDTETNTIATLQATLPIAAGGIVCGSVGTKIYISGGNASGGALDTINVFDTETNTISTMAATLPHRGVCNCAVFGTKCYLFAGNTIDVFDTASETVTTIAATVPSSANDAIVGTVGTAAYIFGGYNDSACKDDINKFTVTFPLAEGDVYLQSDVFKNKFTLVTAPTEVKTGVSAVYVGNAQNEAEYAEALLYDGAAWQPIT